MLVITVATTCTLETMCFHVQLGLDQVLQVYWFILVLRRWEMKDILVLALARLHVETIAVRADCLLIERREEVEGKLQIIQKVEYKLSGTLLLSNFLNGR